MRTLILFIALVSFSTSFASERSVRFHGKVLNLDGGARNTQVIVQRPGTAADTTEVGASGGFELLLAADEQALVTFVQDGYVTKQVDITTVNAISPFSKDDQRNVRFDVELVPQNEDESLAFAAPVGHVTFAKGGLLKVSYDHELITVPGTGPSANIH